MMGPRDQMMQMAIGYWLSKGIYCAARAGVADRLADGPRPVEELAAEEERVSKPHIGRAPSKVPQDPNVTQKLPVQDIMDEADDDD